MRRTGIDDKMIFYVRRYSEPEIGSYFDCSVKKVICNPNEAYKYYLKIGGVTFLPKKKIPGKKNSTSAERIKDSNYFGSYIYYGEIDKRIRCILYAKRKGLPDLKLTGQPSCLHSVIPRYEGFHKRRIISGMKVNSSLDSSRRWSRFDCKTKAHHKGFFEIHNDDDFDHLFENIPGFDNEHKTGIYVGANTSVLMVDCPRAHLYVDYSRFFVYTLFQEGAFICTNRPFTFCFYDEEESEEYDFTRLWAEKRSKLGDIPNLELLSPHNTEKNRILFLQSAPKYTFWTIRANRFRRTLQVDMMLCIPTGGQLEDIYLWDEGIEEVKLRQSSNPWFKYIEYLDAPDPQMENIDLDKNEAYPT